MQEGMRKERDVDLSERRRHEFDAQMADPEKRLELATELASELIDSTTQLEGKDGSTPQSINYAAQWRAILTLLQFGGHDLDQNQIAIWASRQILRRANR